MKNLILILLLLLTSCSSSKSSTNNHSKIASFKEKTNFTINIAETWKSYSQHGYLNYTPKTFENPHDYYKCTFRVIQINKDASLEYDLEAYSKHAVKLAMESLDSFSFDVSTKETSYGTAVIVNSTHNWNGIEFQEISHIYYYKEIIYHLVYSSSKQYFNEYKDEAIEMLNSFKVVD